MGFMKRNVYIIKVKRLRNPFGLSWDYNQSDYFITRFRIEPSDIEYMITDVECRIISCTKIIGIDSWFRNLVELNVVSFLKRSILFDNFTICKKVKLDKLKRMIK